MWEFIHNRIKVCHLPMDIRVERVGAGRAVRIHFCHETRVDAWVREDAREERGERGRVGVRARDHREDTVIRELLERWCGVQGLVFVALRA